MTYGEYWIEVKTSMKMEKGQWIICKPRPHVPKQMSRNEAGSYYNNKLKAFWNLRTC